MTTPQPFLPAEGNQPVLPKHAPAGVQLGRLLDALLILQVERTARVADLARRVGLQPDRLRELLSSYMVAGADAVGTQAPFNITFGTTERSLGAGPEDDDQQAAADVVRISAQHPTGALLADVALTPVTVEDVTRALLTCRAVLVSHRLDERHRSAVEQLATRLEEAMRATVSAPVDDVADQLRSAAAARRTVSFTYRDPWTREREAVEAEPYDVRRHRDRLVLDAGPEPTIGYRTYDLSGITDLRVGDAAFEPPGLPPVDQRDGQVDVVVRIPKDDARADHWLTTGWGGLVIGPTEDGRVDVRIRVDAGNAAARLGVLLLRLGPSCVVVEPASLRAAAAPVAVRLLSTLPS